MDKDTLEMKNEMSISMGGLNIDQLSMHDAQLGQQWCDVTLIVEGKAIHAHRIVLSAAIPYFNVMLNSGMIESQQRVITMDGIAESTLALLINFAYTGRLTINSENAPSLLLGASYLMLDAVSDACKQFIKATINKGNCLFYLTSKNYEISKEIGEAADTFCQHNFSDVMRTDDFLKLNIATLTDLLTRDRLCVQSEREVYDSVIRWVNYSLQKRRNLLPRLLGHIRLTRISMLYLHSKVLHHKLIKNSSRLIFSVKRAIEIQRIHRMISYPIERPRAGLLFTGGIYVLGERQETKAQGGDRIEILSPRSQHWFTAASMLSPALNLGVAIIHETLYAFGGNTGISMLGLTLKYKMRANKWYNLNCDIHARFAMGVTGVKDDLYLCGGVDNNGATKIVEKFSPFTNGVCRLKDMRMARNELGVTALEGSVYAVGGRNGDRVYMSAERYDSKRNQWRSIAGMFQKRCRHGVATLNGRLYACGGYDGIQVMRCCEYYDSRENKWMPIMPMVHARTDHALVANLGRLWAIGGNDGPTKLSSVESYDPKIGRWELEPSLAFHHGNVVGVANVK